MPDGTCQTGRIGIGDKSGMGRVAVATFSLVDRITPTVHIARMSLGCILGNAAVDQNSGCSVTTDCLPVGGVAVSLAKPASTRMLDYLRRHCVSVGLAMAVAGSNS